MYNVHQDALLVPLHLETDNYTFEGKSIPAVSASASKKDGDLNISLTNIDYAKAQEVTISLRGENYSAVSGQILGSGSILDHNTFENPEKIKVKDFSGAKLTNGVLKLTVPAHSVIVLNLK
ncbi:Intracellular exo-alpha-L-arabinofuranosidase 2 [compost metagenome]